MKAIHLSLMVFFTLFLSGSALFAQNANDYAPQWKTIDSLQGVGLPKSALEKTEALYQRIKKDTKNTKQSAQLIKALIYLNKYQSQLEEEGLVKAIGRFEEEILSAQQPTRSILESMTAEMYDRYLSNNLYKIQQRTSISSDAEEKDIRMWTVDQLTKRSFELYHASLKDPSTKTTKADDNYKDLIYMDKSGDGLRPTLYDVLAERALNYFMNERSYITQPVYQFYLDNPDALKDINTFVNAKFTAKDENSMKYKTILLFQEVLKFHMNSEYPKALANYDLKRISYVYTNAVIPNKDQLYLDLLTQMEKNSASNPFNTEIAYYLARFHYDKGSNYQPSPKETNRWRWKTAYEICQKAVSRFPNSYGAGLCKSLQNTLRQKSLSINISKYNIPNKPVLVNINYRNVAKGNCRLFKVTKEQLNNFYEKSGDKQLKYLKNLKPIKSWSVKLNSDGDFRQHATEIGLESQDKGIYLLAISENENFSYEANGVAYTHFYHSNIAYTSRQVESKYEFYVTDRTTGQPLADVTVEFYENRYNSLFRKYEKRKIGEGKTDKSGKISSMGHVKLNNRNYYSRTYSVKFTHNDDVLETDENYYNYHYNPSDNSYKTTHFFLDRAIYRPGQTVYFKGLAIYSKGSKEHDIVKNQEVEVIFYDANYQEVTRQKFTTNDYGTFNGSFNAPTSGLTGQMRLTSSFGSGTKYFRVEEYKRPKFEVKFPPIKGSFKLDDKVVVKGNAKAFAGNNIDGAQVKYRIVRQAQFPYWRWWEWGYYNPYNRVSQEIKFGETKTNEKGEFEIEFTAVADKSIPKEQNPQFVYTVYADVVDITGETRSSSSRVTVGYIALAADVSIAGQVNKKELEEISISTKNLNGTFEAAAGSITIEALQSPSTVYVSRSWSVPDQYSMDESTFKGMFPDYPFKKEDDKTTWKVASKVMDVKFDTKTSKTLKLDKIKSWKQGAYKLTLKTQDKFNNPIEVIKYFTLTDPNAKKVPLNDKLFAEYPSGQIEPGETFKINLGSTYKDAQVLYEVEHENQIVSSQWLTVNDRQTLEFKVEEKHRGNVFFHLNMVKDNRTYQKVITAFVPWSNKELKVEYSTFRDKLYPGQEEEWKIKVSGLNKDKVAAEVLATMYDASLDAFAANTWNFNLYGSNYPDKTLSSSSGFSTQYSSLNYDYYKWWERDNYSSSRTLPYINWFNFSFYDYGGRYYDEMEMVADAPAIDNSNRSPQPTRGGGRMLKKEKSEEKRSKTSSLSTSPLAPVANQMMDADLDGIPEEQSDDAEGDADFGDVKVRTNLNETVFFFPNLMTDAEGNVIIKFTMNEALTRWKFMAFAHTKDLKSKISTREIVTQKDLMIVPNAPRFFRQNDEMYFTAKVSNLTEKGIKGKATLQLFDALTMKPVDAAFANTNSVLPFDTKAKQSAPLSWKIKVPNDWTTAITYRVIAKADNFSDGEENALPVLTNRMLVTETMPLPIRGNQTKVFDFKRMAEVSKSKTMSQHKMTLEFTPNPAWYAVQALPYLMEYPYECTEQIFSRYYANSLASSVANSHPKVKRVFEQWKNVDKDALKSNLAKNEELKYALLEETPWVLASQSEEKQKANLGVLFDLNRMANELGRAQDKMADRQLANGGFAWFSGGRDNWYITQYIVEGMGHLDALGVKNVKEDAKVSRMLTKAVAYTDDRLAEQYRELLKWAKKSKNEKEYLAKNNLNYMVIHYMYARSFFPDQPIKNETTKKALAYYEGQAKKYWLTQSNYMQGMLALGLHRDGKDKETPQAIVKSLRERSLNSEEMGMYWKYPSGYFWYQLPIETHALLIEVFDEVAQDEKAVNDLKTWLLKAKQTTHWKTTKATASACYALLGRGQNWLVEDQEIEITLGSQKLDQSKIKKEAGTGYFKTSWEKEEIKPDMAKITVKNPNDNVAWGAVYWQYFEDLDKITHFKETPLKLTKKLFKQVNTNKGPVLKPIDKETLKPGDLIKVRIELEVDRDMEYVHMKDARAAGFEPVNVLSQYKYQGGLGYYESTRDASTNFFFSYLSKGSYVFEYPIRVNHKGDFSNGITTIQCMYAPEFTAHSEGVRVQVK